MTVNKEETKGGEPERMTKDQVMESDSETETGSETGSGTTSSTISEGSSTEIETTASSSSTASTSSSEEKKEEGEKKTSTEQKPVIKEQEGRRNGVQVPSNAATAGGQRRRQGGGPRGGEPDKDLDSVVVEMKNGRRLFIDAKENSRGKFVRLSETTNRVQSDRRNGRIMMRMKVAKEVSKRLAEFIDAAEQAEISKKQEGGDEEKREVGPGVRPLHSVTILDDGRRYFIDLLPSRFEEREPVVRITMSSPLSGQRVSVTVESSEVPVIKEAFEAVLQKCYSEAEEKAGDEEEEHTIRFGRRTYHFQSWNQTRGNFVRVTEVAPVNGRMLRSSLVVPDKVLAKFAQMLSGYDAKMNAGRNEGKKVVDGSGASSTSSAAGSDKKGIEGSSDGGDKKKGSTKESE